MVASTAKDGLQSLRVEKEIVIHAPLDIAYECLLEELGPACELPGKPMPMVFEAWPGGRWFRDLGDQSGHLWGHVQVIKPQALIEITGPLFMSYPAINHLRYKLVAEGVGTKLTLLHRAFGEIEPEHRSGVNEGWGNSLARMQQLAATRARSK
ncbi:MAG: SRPBCC domain-containing protein [Pirellulales bacterium]